MFRSAKEEIKFEAANGHSSIQNDAASSSSTKPDKILIEETAAPSFNENVAKIQEMLVSDVELIFSRSYGEMQRIFIGEFQASKSFKQMMLVMNENMVEFQFMRQAGLV